MISISLKDFFQKIKSEITSGEDAVFCMVAEKRGSAPRGVGAHMLVLSDGSALDTVGGGSLEHAVRMQAAENLKKKKSSLQEFCLNNNQAAESGMICGGALTVLLQYLNVSDLPEIEKALQLLKDGGRIVIASDWTSDDFSFAAYSLQENFSFKDKLTSGKNKAALILDGAGGHYREILRQRPTVYLFGGGYVAQAAAKLLPALEFPYVVIEERREFADKKLFPHAEKIVVAPYEEFSQKIKIKECDFAVVVTSGHQKDALILNELLKKPPFYIGAIGSRRKRAVINEYLSQQGHCGEKINSIIMPIGLDIKADTPEEIAVSIAAQLIKKRASL